MTPPTLPALKAQAKRLRQSLAEAGTQLSHSQALEAVARQHGSHDWNTLCALSQPEPPPVPRIGAPAHGRYLGQPFTGRLKAASTLANGHLRITLRFDEAVDVVTFDSFSSFRRQVTAVIDRKGRSPRRTSNGQPQLVVTWPHWP